MLKAIAKNFYSLILYKNTLGYSQLTVEVKNEFQFQFYGTNHKKFCRIPEVNSFSQDGEIDFCKTVSIYI